MECSTFSSLYVTFIFRYSKGNPLIDIPLDSYGVVFDFFFFFLKIKYSFVEETKSDPWTLWVIMAAAFIIDG